MDLMTRRRALMRQKNGELYPVGTDLITMYIGRTENNGNFNFGYEITRSGEYTISTGNAAASPIYMEINPSYRYQKTRILPNTIAGRILCFAYYDKNYDFISSVVYNNLNVIDLPAPPANAKYARLSTLGTSNNWTIAIVRIA